MTTKNTPTAPTHIVWFAPERENAPWSRIGALWPTRNGTGFRMHLELMPVAAGNLIILPPESREGGAGGGA